MKFNTLINTIVETQNRLQKKTIQAINQSLVIRNWLIGYYIVEYEQSGRDRAKYGRKLLNNLAQEIKKHKIKGLSQRILELSRKFYLSYPQISQTVSAKFKSYLKAASNPSSLILNKDDLEYQKSPKELLENFSFSHFIEFMTIKEPFQRYFYESLAIKNSWSVRHLKRQVDSMLFERTALSKDKNALIKDNKSNKDIELTPADIIKDPYCFEFLGFNDKEMLSTESKLETKLLDHLQDFLLELGEGFCFEARQKRFTIDNNHYMVDLVFYHRILKCHILLELKTRKFSHLDTGQLNFYLNYFKDTQMSPGDNPPIGIVLCLDNSNKTEVKYATTGIDQQMFVSKYKLALPSEEELKKVIEKDH